ncbi:MAG: Crp/Fnr family transcriptional regulator [Bacteroidota bacterium]|jgi:CRP-like cAMP-binding protein|nr:Crp/Fnr family transcriptional regulator [Microcystis sp. M065S1]MCA6491713.1 Crp/Fnr family transcriptional regulator [Chitinophagaceae bacterium]
MNIFETGEKKFIKKGALLLQQGEICKFGCKVISGCLKSYVLDDTGKEHIMQFAPEGWIITDMNSLFNHTPSNITIAAIEDSEVHWIESAMLDFWEDASREELLEQIKMLTRNIITANKRTRMLLSSTGEERYIDFIQTYPTLTQRLPLKLIAAYIGITPEYLSEIRRKFAGKRIS